MDRSCSLVLKTPTVWARGSAFFCRTFREVRLYHFSGHEQSRPFQNGRRLALIASVFVTDLKHLHEELMIADTALYKSFVINLSVERRLKFQISCKTTLPNLDGNERIFNQ